MLTKEENERLTQVGPGTPMGNLLRRYWLPIAVSAEVTNRPVKRKLLGEDLVVFRTPEGQVGVVDERCAHRRTSLTVGISETGGIRCGYHGWKYALSGEILEQPAEPRTNPAIKIPAYPAEEMGGLIFAYLGPQPAPLLPRFDLFVEEGCLRDIGHANLEFNWLQAMENSVDPYHGEWLHGHFMNAAREIAGQEPITHYAKKHAKVAFDVFEYGIVKRRLLEGGSEDEDGWKIGHPLLFPYMLKIGGAGFRQFQIRVPLDDLNTWHIWYTVYKPETGGVPEQPVVPSYHVPLKDENGEYIVDFIDGQDIAAWAGQGRVADRTKEMLGSSDLGLAIFRKMLKEEMAKVERNEDPRGVVRDPAKNVLIELPVERKKPHADDRTYLKGILDAQAVRHSPINRQIRELFGLPPA